MDQAKVVEPTDSVRRETQHVGGGICARPLAAVRSDFQTDSGHSAADLQKFILRADTCQLEHIKNTVDSRSSKSVFLTLTGHCHGCPFRGNGDRIPDCGVRAALKMG